MGFFDIFSSYTSVLVPVVQNFALIFDSFGVILVLIGAFVAFWNWLQAETVHRNKPDKKREDVENLRVHFAQKMVLGLEFFLAGDLLRLMTTPSFEVLTRVGVIIVIRTILTFFLSREIRAQELRISKK